MTPTPIWVFASDDMSRAEALMEAQGIRHLPVKEEGQIVGVLSERDLRTARAARDPLGRPDFNVGQICSRPAYVVDVQTPLGSVCRALAAHQMGCAVVTAGGELAGILTTMDVCRLYADRVESC